MKRMKKTILMTILLFSLTGCGNKFVSVEEYDKVVQELEIWKNNYTTIEEKYYDCKEQLEEYKNKNILIDEKQNNIVFEKEYLIDNDTFKFNCIKDNDKYSIIILCSVENKSKAFETFTALRVSTDINFLDIEEYDEYTKKFCQGISKTITFFVSVDDGTNIMVSNSIGNISVSKNEETINIDDYFSEEWISSDEYENNNYIEQVSDFYLDFVENLPTEVLNSFLDANTTNENKIEKTENLDDFITPGKTFSVNGLKITFNECDLDFTDYEDEYGWYAPDDGKKYVMASFTYNNESNSDKYVSIYDFNCYADGTVCEQSYYFDTDFINANISPNRNVSFRVFYVVPVDCNEIELEYETNLWTGEKQIIKLQ